MNICDILINIGLAALGVVLALWYENLGSPRLLIFPHVTTQSKKENGLTTKFLHLKVKNAPRKFPFVPTTNSLCLPWKHNVLNE